MPLAHTPWPNVYNSSAPSMTQHRSRVTVISRPSEAQNCLAYCSYNDYCTISLLTGGGVNHGQNTPEAGHASHQKTSSWSITPAEQRISQPRTPDRDIFSPANWPPRHPQTGDQFAGENMS